MARAVTSIPGDGIGPAVTAATRAVLDATGVALESELHQIEQPAAARADDPLPGSVVDSVRANGVALKGPCPLPSVAADSGL